MIFLRGMAWRLRRLWPLISDGQVIKRRLLPRAKIWILEGELVIAVGKGATSSGFPLDIELLHFI